MADNREVVIRIVDETKEQNKTGVNGASEGNTKDIFGTATISYLTNKGVSYLENVLVGEVKYQINRYFSLTDNYLGQQDLRIALSVLNKIGGIVSSTIMAGSVAGPAGAIITLIGSLTTTAQSIYHNYDQQIIQLAKMNAQLEFNRERSGYSLTAGSRGENK